MRKVVPTFHGRITVRIRITRDGGFVFDEINDIRGPLGFLIEPELGMSDFENI